MIGLSLGTTVNTLSNTATVAQVTTQFIGIIQEVGANTFSYYSRGSASGTTPVDSTITCQTVNTGWYTFTLHNDFGSNDVTMTLRYSVGGTTSTNSHTITCGSTSTISTSTASYILMQRNMGSSGGTTGAGILSLGSIKYYYV
jgi:hypothetical protein